MGVIKVTDYVKHAYTYEDGLVIFSEIEKHISKNENVTLSFERIDSIPSSFANGCFVKLLEIFGTNTVKKHLKIEKSTKQINQMIKDRINFESNRIGNKGNQTNTDN